MSTGGGPNSEIAKLSIGIEATGADAAVKDIDSVAEAAQQAETKSANAAESAANAAAMAAKAASDKWYQYQQMISGPGIEQGPSIVGDEQDRKRFVTQQEAATRATRRFSDANKENAATFRSVKQDIFGTIGIIGSFVGAVHQVVNGVRGYQDAARGLSVTLGELNKQQAIDTTIGLTQEQSLRRRADLMQEQQKAAEETRKATQDISGWWADLISDNASGQLVQQQIDTARRGAEASIEALGKNQQDIDKETSDKKKELDRQERLDSTIKQTDELQLQAELLNANEVTKIKIEAGRKINDLAAAARQEEDAELRALYLEQIGYIQKIRDARIQAIDDAAAKEMQRQKEMAEGMAKAFSEAFSREARAASDSIRDAFRDANTTNYLRDAAQSLRAILQQRRL